MNPDPKPVSKLHAHPTDIQRMVQEALGPLNEFNPDSVNVETNGSQVILTGTVRSRVTAKAVKQIARLATRCNA